MDEFDVSMFVNWDVDVNMCVIVVFIDFWYELF